MTPEELAARLEKRVRGMSTADLMEWADMAIAGMMRQMDDFRKHPVEDHLAEIDLGCTSLQAVCSEMTLRLRQARGTMAESS